MRARGRRCVRSREELDVGAGGELGRHRAEHDRAVGRGLRVGGEVHPVAAAAAIGVGAWRRDTTRPRLPHGDERAAGGAAREVDVDEREIADGGALDEDRAPRPAVIGVPDAGAAGGELGDADLDGRAGHGRDQGVQAKTA